jgi:hypothetical protein
LTSSSTCVAGSPSTTTYLPFNKCLFLARPTPG